MTTLSRPTLNMAIFGLFLSSGVSVRLGRTKDEVPEDWSSWLTEARSRNGETYASSSPESRRL